MNVEQSEIAQRQADFCSVFGNARRVMILWSLIDHERTVGDIASTIDASMQNTSQHLRLMKERGILESRRDGQTIYYRVSQDFPTRNCPLRNQYFALSQSNIPNYKEIQNVDTRTNPD